LTVLVLRTTGIFFQPLGLRVEKGDYILFHADHAGTEVDFEVQGVIAYEV